ncbi:MAG: DNA-binding transcriptional LysR family regulator [Kiritimatiellia bacterium]|jgi:DNA-binding transcriptional LysR family regulator
MQKRMNWSAINFDWNRARAFLVTAEEGSFSAAARKLDSTQPTVGRQIAALEAELDVLLFERVGRSLKLTSTGQDLIEHVRAMAKAATRVSLTAAGQSLSLDGVICISASEVISAHLLPPIITKLRATHPGIEVEIIASNLPSDLQRREADIAVRSFRPKQPELVARKVRESRGFAYASPELLERIGNPTSLKGLYKADFAGFDRSNMMIDGLNALGFELTQSNFPIVTSNHLVQWELAKQGACICIMMEEIGDLEPKVQRVPGQLNPMIVPMWLVSHRELRTSRRVRVVFEFLATELTPQPPHRPADQIPTSDSSAGLE